MRLYYQGTDITDDVDIVSAVHRDVSDGRQDCLELVLDHAAAWYRWGPKRDDMIRIIDGEYDTGTTYLSAIAPEGDSFRIFATAGKSNARRKAWESFENRTLGEIFAHLAAQDGMESKIYGVNDGYIYPYLLRENESCAAFLSRLSHREGAVLKTVLGRYACIGITAAQDIPPSATIELSVRQDGVTYLHKKNTQYASVTVKTPYAAATAYDKSAADGEAFVISDIPAMDNATAGRWARGLLLTNNRKAEILTIESEHNAGFTAMARIDVRSETDMNGEWIIDEAEHDFVRRRSRARLYRCIRTVV